MQEEQPMKAALPIAVCVIGAFVVFIGCATSVPVTVTKPAEVNMASMRKIAVLDFIATHEGYDLSVESLIEAALEELFDLSVGERAVERIIEEYTTERFILGLVNTNYFQVVGASEVRQSLDPVTATSTSVQEIGKEVGAQGIVTGEIYFMMIEDEEFVKTEELIDSETNEKYEEDIPWIRRTATLGLTYHVFNTDSGALHASRSFEASLQDEKEAAEDYSLQDSKEMFREIVDSFIPQMMRQLAPYTVRESRKLMKDKAKDPLMVSARQYARSGVYDRALELYLDVWDTTKNPAAGFNGAIMYEVTGNIDAAVSLMKDVADRYPEKKILREYNRLLGVREEQKRLAEQLT
jgi:hypothetical protein